MMGCTFLAKSDSSVCRTVYAVDDSRCQHLASLSFNSSEY